jgi:hypothetical protein
MLFHIFDWTESTQALLRGFNYTLHGEGMFCVESEGKDIFIFSKDELIHMDQHQNVGQLIGLCGAIGLLTCMCSVMAFKLATQTRYYAIFQPKPEEEGIPPQYTQQPVQV